MSDETGIEQIQIEDEMRASFLDYAMSVIVSRALPDVRDGLKPVHRRILVTLRDLGLLPERGFRKCAKICGDVSGNYHPHGESIVYPSLVRLGQDFSLRYPLVWGQGNFGSIDGDPPAAMRYTEAKMTHICTEMLRDIQKNTVDFVPNYDETRQEPVVLPAAIPNLLVNGSSGIAVGMATNIPPHNLTEVVDALVALIDNPEIDLSGLLDYVKGPDFPTGATIHGIGGILQAYRTGRGKIKIRARTHFEEDPRRDRTRIVITEIPYQVNKTALIEKIADLVRDKRIEGIADLRDESDRRGMRIVIDLKRGAIGDVILNQLFRYTPLESTFGINMLALVDKRPKVLSLRDMMVEYLKHRREVVIRRSRFDLAKHRARAHIVEGLLKALDHLDEVIALIRRADTPAEAKEGLMTRFGLSDKQAQAILDMRLQRLTGLERRKLAEEYAWLKAEIERLEAILASEARQMAIVREELLEVRERYGDERRTEICEDDAEVDMEDLIAREDIVVMLTRGGYIKRTPVSEYRIQGRAGVGVSGMATKEDDVVEHVALGSTHDYLLFFTNRGRVHALKGYRIPEFGRQSKGRALPNLLHLNEGERVAALLVVSDFEDEAMVVLATREGIVKKTRLSAFRSVASRQAGLTALTLRDEDQLIQAVLTDGSRDLIMATAGGMLIRFGEDDVRPMGRQATGVHGIKLDEGDLVVTCAEVHGDEDILTVCALGRGRRTPLSDYRRQGRYGRGLTNFKVDAASGQVVAAVPVHEGDQLIVITAEGRVLRLDVQRDSIRPMSRHARGVRLVRLYEGDRVAAVCRYEEESDA